MNKIACKTYKDTPNRIEDLNMVGSVVDRLHLFRLAALLQLFCPKPLSSTFFAYKDTNKFVSLYR